jgi:hypothetical protein
LKIGVAFNGALNMTLKKRSSYWPLIPFEFRSNRVPYMFIHFLGRVGLIEISLITKARDLTSGFVRRDITFVRWEIGDGQAGLKYSKMNDTKAMQ